jgi:GntR family transcriptional regulator
MTPIPKYFAISKDIITSIESRQLLPGMRAPSENEIIRDYQVSNTTARKALGEVEAAGYVTRIRGRGTIVLDKAIERSATKILSFTKNMLAAGITPTTQVLDARVMQQGFTAEINHRSYTMRGPVFKIHRLRLGDGVPLMLEVRYISLGLCPGLQTQDLEGSLYDVYRERYNLHLSKIDQMLSATTIDEQLGSFFGIQSSIPAVKVESATFCGKEIILEMETSIYRGDKYRFSIQALP